MSEPDTLGFREAVLVTAQALHPQEVPTISKELSTHTGALWLLRDVAGLLIGVVDSGGVVQLARKGEVRLGLVR